jgi:hypothetical protein
VTLNRIKKWLHFTVAGIFMFIKPASSIPVYLNINKAEVHRITNINMIYIFTCSLQAELKNDGSWVLVKKARQM